MDPLSPDRLKSLGLRLGLPLLAIWVVGALIAGVVHSEIIQGIALGLPAVLTVAAAVLLGWGLRQARKAQGVAGILSRATTKDDRQAALAELEAKYKGSDPTAIFARSQLLLQDGEPRKALAALESINLSKVMANVADEARGQRAMIHLMLDEVPPARDLVDGIQLSRHQDAKSRAMLAAIVAEAWARSGQAKRAADTLSVFDADDAELAQLRPQLFRAQAYAFAHTDDLKSARRALRRLADQEPRLLGSFLGRKTHPLLQKEAKKLLEQSGAVPRKMQVQRR
ncbi:MAG TPA: hypothetical protein VFS67_25290 [Polyangiaceae bacterium]|nr:hypothetical protein [Polyangiaceae bacterium]